MGTSWGCEVDGCGAHPRNGDSILRTSPLGEPFRGRCAEHLATQGERAQLEEDESLGRLIQRGLEERGEDVEDA
jgi:hypothetical protein